MRKARNGRCRLHGGKSSIDKNPAPYIGAVLPNEVSLFAALPVGTVDDELKLCRLRLGRAAAAEAKLIASGESEGLTRIQDEINRITTRIDRFENRRAQLLALAAAAVAAGLAPDDALDDPHALARAIRVALDEIELVTAPDEDSSDGDADA
jgi:crotonobetainyl-CoA:carnitine CoA-transferase CaiB-like acyl-CoA transferase